MEEYIDEAYDASEEEEIIGLYDKELHLKMLQNTMIKNASNEGYEKGYDNGKNDGIEIGKEVGKKEGIKQKQKEIAKNMLNNGLDIEMIVSCTGLSKEEIEKL